MKKFLHIAALLLLAVSCEIPFDLDQAGEPRIYMQAIAKGAHVRIVPLVANPVTGARVADAPMDIRVELNGEPLSVHPEDSISYAASYWPIEEGDEVSVTVRSGSLAPVTGVTRFPPSVVVEDFSWERVQVDTIKAVEVSVRLDHEPGEEEYYGIRIHRQDHLLLPDHTYLSYYNYLTPGYILTAGDIGKFDLEDFVQVNYDDHYLGGRDFQPLTLVTRKQFDGDTYRFYINSFDTSILNGIRGSMPGGQTGAAGGGIISGEVNPSAGGGGQVNPPVIPIGRRTIIHILLSRLSPEFYFFAKALYQSNFDFLANMGLVPANFTWSNVEGGMGFVGAISTVTLDPIDFTEYFQK